MEIVYENKDVIVVNKKSGIATQSEKSGEKCLLDEVREYAKDEEIGLVHRLDKPVGGLVVFTKNKNALKNLNEQVQKRKIKKEYVAVVNGEDENKVLTDYLFKNQRLNVSKVVHKNSMSAKEAILEYENVDKVEVNGKILSKIKIKLHTGRHHQIRVQLSNNETAIYGDRKYNKQFIRKRGDYKLGLFAYKLEFKHPSKKTIISLEIDLPDEEPFNFFK